MHEFCCAHDAGTHDVQEVTIDFTPTSITASCQFAVGSLALGCSIHIFDQMGAEVTVETLMRDPNGQGLPLVVEVTVEELESGVYTVRVYDIESDGQTSNGSDPAHIQTVDITQPTTPTPTSSDTPGTTPGELHDLWGPVTLNTAGIYQHTLPFSYSTCVCVCSSECIATCMCYDVLRYRYNCSTESRR